jgi:hypothetical protein
MCQNSGFVCITYDFLFKTLHIFSYRNARFLRFEILMVYHYDLKENENLYLKFSMWPAHRRSTQSSLETALSTGVALSTELYN